MRSQQLFEGNKTIDTNFELKQERNKVAISIKLRTTPIVLIVFQN